MAITNEDIKTKRLEVLRAQKALLALQSELQQLQIQKQIDDVTQAAAPQ